MRLPSDVLSGRSYLLGFVILHERFTGCVTGSFPRAQTQREVLKSQEPIEYTPVFGKFQGKIKRSGLLQVRDTAAL